MSPLVTALVVVGIVCVAMILREWDAKRLSGPEAADAGAGDTCRGCGYDLRASPKRCPECGRMSDAERRRRLREEWPTSPIEPRRPKPDERWHRLYQAENGYEAKLIQEQLEGRGVAARIESRATTYLLSGSYTAAHEVNELWVPESDLEAGRAILVTLLGVGIEELADERNGG